jgi:hypothetical protein
MPAPPTAAAAARPPRDQVGGANRAVRRRRRGSAAGVARRRRSPRWLVLHAGVDLVLNRLMVVTWLLSPDPATVRGVPPGV